MSKQLESRKIRDSLLQLNSALLKSDINCEDVIILLGDLDFIRIRNTMDSGVGALAKHYQFVNESEMVLAGIRVKRYNQQDED